MDTTGSPSSPAALSHSLPGAKRGTLRVAELYSSRQGEGVLTGTESTFVRISGCNLRCWFCDTPHASWSPEGRQQSVDQIVDQVQQLALQHVVVTGGEPLLFPAIVSLCATLRAAGCHITVETAGTLFQPVASDLMSISPKLASSGPLAESLDSRWEQLHAARRWQPDVIRQLIEQAPAYQMKFVVDQPADCQEVLEMVDTLSPVVSQEHVWIMPQAQSLDELQSHATWLVPWCQQQGYHYCDRMQLRWFGSRRGT